MIQKLPRTCARIVPSWSKFGRSWNPGLGCQLLTQSELMVHCITTGADVERR
jgi:hypothetical protein